MGSFVFKWDHPATEVYVTGTFDDWSRSEKLVKTGDIFEKKVTLPSVDEKIYYKFVADETWVTDPTAPQENDASGNLNNVLTPERITKHTPATAGIMSGVTPTSTTADLAKDVPLEKGLTESDLPGAFPVTPAAADDSEKGDFSVNPLPATAGAVNPIKLEPGEKVPDPSTITTNTVTSGVHDDPELVAAEKAKTESEQVVSVAPLPAFEGAVNPIKLAPGEKVPDPSTITANTVTSGVHDDPELVALEKAKGGVGAATIQSAGPESTTAQLAAGVPVESSKVPDVVKESQLKAGFPPEASAVPEEVIEKKEVEKEILNDVPAAKPTSEGPAKGDEKSKTITPGEKAAAAAGGAAASSAAVIAAVKATKSTNPTAHDTPEVVKQSIAKSGQAPEAASNEEAVLEKKATENELLAGTKPETSTGEPAPKIAPAAGAVSTAKDTPAVVKESIAESGKGPEAASNEEAVLEKKAAEKELLSEVKLATSTGEPAPKIVATPAPASTTTTGLNAPATAPVAGKPAQSREVSPGTIPGDHPQSQTKPVVTDGVVDSTTEKATPAPVAAAPVAGAGGAAAAAAPATGTSKTTESVASSADADKKKKRTSLFGRIKAKLSDKTKN